MKSPVAVLVSGGLDSAVLCLDLLNEHARVHPVFIRNGLQWENQELIFLQRFLAAAARPALAPLKILHLPVDDIYGRHWSITGESVPDETTPDEAVYLPGRNLLLLSKVGVLCETIGAGYIALATLKGNPFADNSDRFYAAMTEALNTALGLNIRILRPYADLDKPAVIRRGAHMPLQFTLSCMQPIDDKHCGRCNKCAERQLGFRLAGIADPSTYTVQTDDAAIEWPRDTTPEPAI